MLFTIRATANQYDLNLRGKTTGQGKILQLQLPWTQGILLSISGDVMLRDVMTVHSIASRIAGMVKVLKKILFYCTSTSAIWLEMLETGDSVTLLPRIPGVCDRMIGVRNSADHWLVKHQFS